MKAKRPLLLVLLLLLLALSLAACGTTRTTIPPSVTLAGSTTPHTTAASPSSFPYDPNGFGQLSLAMDPKNPSTLYAGTTTDLFKSGDGAGSWNKLPTVGGGVNFVVVDPASPSSVYVWTNLFDLRRSDDGGATWTDLSTAGPPDVSPSHAVWFDTTSTPSTIYARGWRTKPKEVKGIWRSTDRGETWTLVTEDKAAQAPTGQQGRSLPPAAQQALDAFLASFGGTVKDAETGAVVRRVPPGDGPVPVIVDPVQPSILYLVMYQGVYKSTDAGRTWRKASVGLVP
jgi:hypothetical protein